MIRILALSASTLFFVACGGGEDDKSTDTEVTDDTTPTNTEDTEDTEDTGSQTWNGSTTATRPT